MIKLGGYHPVPKTKYKRHKQKRGNRNNFTASERRKVKEYFKNTCQECGKYGESLHIHHIKPKGSSNGRAVLTNALLLCGECHQKIHGDPNQTRLKYWQQWAVDQYGENYFKDKRDLIEQYNVNHLGEIDDLEAWLKHNGQK